jgi:hypothetical protein
MAPSLHPFNTSKLSKHFCFTLTEPSAEHKKTVLEVTSEDSFFTWKLFLAPMYNATLPAFNEKVYLDISRHFLLVFSALWSSPSHHILNATSWLIANKLHGFNYTTVHKRSFEGGCIKLMERYQSYAHDYDGRQIDLNHSAWYGDIQHHPICEMPASFALSTMALNHRQGQNIYVAFDGRGSIADYEAINATSIASLDPTAVDEPLSNHFKKFVDMLVAMNGDFFIMNPYSTFSFQVFVVRVVLGLESVPLMNHRDVYFNQVNDTSLHHLWVSVYSIIAAYESLKKEIHQ